MTKIIFALFLACVIAAAAEAKNPFDHPLPVIRGGEPEPKAPPSSIAKAVLAMKLKPGWERIELNSEKPTTYAFTLWYKPNVRVTATALEADTKQVARGVLAELVRAGRKPAEDGIFVHVDAAQAVRGETGKRLERSFGAVRYSPYSDTMKFYPTK